MYICIFVYVETTVFAIAHAVVWVIISPIDWTPAVSDRMTSVKCWMELFIVVTKLLQQRLIIDIYYNQTNKLITMYNIRLAPLLLHKVR